MRRYLGRYKLDADKRPVRAADDEDLALWDIENRIVAKTQITDEIEVSTVFIVLDHRHHGDGPPLLFETMIFGGPLNGEIWRYSTWDDAEIGHKAIVRKVRKAIRQKQE